MSDPRSVGMSPQRLARIGTFFESEIERGSVPGAVLLVARHGELVWSGEFGWRDPVARDRMTTDCLFRLASMTKPVVSVAVLLLVEEGRLQLIDPLSKYLPELGNRLVAAANGIEGTQAAQREITLQDLLRHTSGLTYGAFGTSSAHRAYVIANPMDLQQSNEEMVHKLARLPLLQQPGTTFEYGLSTDVLGRVVEVASGVGLDRFIAERIARPLDLPSFTFQATEADARRLARAQPDDAENAELNELNRALHPVRWLSGGGGLNSNARDYLRFAQMLLNGGELGGVRLLGPKTVALMCSDALPPDVSYGEYVDTLGSLAPTAAMGQGFGLGLTVRVAAGRNPLPGSIGDCSWAGRWGTYFWIDPAEQLACVLMMQAPAERTRFRALARTLVYQAIETMAPANTTRMGE